MSHKITDALNLTAAGIIKIMLGRDTGNQLLKVPLSNNIIGRRINDMDEDISDQLLFSLKEKYASLTSHFEKEYLYKTSQ